MLLDIRKYDEPVQINLTLCKPDFMRTPIACLGEAYDKKITLKLGNIDELSFIIPKTITINGITQNNQNYDLLKGKMFVLCEILNHQQYFIVVESNEYAEGDKIYKEVKCYSLEYQFTKRNIRGYSGTKKIFDIVEPEKGVLNYICSICEPWQVGYVNPDINLKFRTFDVSEQSVWDFLTDIQLSFGCVFEFDTVNYIINVKKLEDIGQNKGLVLSENNYIKYFELKPNYDEVVTRLRCYGSENISIHSVNPTGTDYIELFDYYKTTDFMSENLINALNEYNNLINLKSAVFQGYLNQLKTLNNEMITLNNQLSDLLMQLKQIQDSIDVAIKINGGSVNVDLSTLRQQERSKQTEIDNKQTEINNKQEEIDDVYLLIAQLKEEISIENNFTEEQRAELNNFVFEKTWQDNNYYDVNELYEEGKDMLLKLAQPAINFEITAINFLKCLDHQENWDKVFFGLGDIVNIEHSKLNTYFEVRLVEFTYAEEANDFDLKFSNKGALDDPLVYLNDLLKNAISSSTTINIEKYKYGKYSKDQSMLLDYINNELDLAKQKALAGHNQEIIIDDRGILLTDGNNPIEQVKMIGNLIVFTDDGWDTAKTAISSRGIIAEHIVGKLIAGNQLIIENQTGTFQVDGNGMSAINMSLSLTSKNGKNKIILNPDNGFKMQKSNGAGGWTDNFYADTDGNLHLTGQIEASTFIGGSINIGNGNFTVDSNGVLTARSGSFKGDITGSTGTFSGILSGGAIVSSNIEASSFTGGSINIGYGKFRVNSNGDLYAESGTFKGNIEGSEISGANITGGEISGVSITGGEISGVYITGSTINIDTNLTVGNNIFIGNPYDGRNKSIHFSTENAIRTDNEANLRIASYRDLLITSHDARFSTQYGTITISEIIDFIDNGGSSDIDAIYDYVDRNFFYNAVYNATSGALKFYNRKGQQIVSVDIG